MIQEISINIKNRGLTHIMQIDTDIESNLHYILAEAFSEAIRLTYANPNMVIEELVAKYGLPESMQIVNDSENENNKMIWHDTDYEPRYDELLLGMGSDGVSIYKWCNQECRWECFVRYSGLKKWAYINDLLPKGGE